MSYYSNPTANRAIGAADKLIRQKAKRAIMLGTLCRAGHLGPKSQEKICREFSGLYRGLRPVALGLKTYKEVFPKGSR